MLLESRETVVPIAVSGSMELGVLERDAQERKTGRKHAVDEKKKGKTGQGR